MIPIKDFSETKTRMRVAIPPQKIKVLEQIVELTFDNVVNAIKSANLRFGVISPSQTLIEKSNSLGAAFTYKDSGKGLNVALREALDNFNPIDPVMIMMSDLPFITEDLFINLMREKFKEDIVIVPSISSNTEDIGTAMLYLKKSNLVDFHYGKNSFFFFQEEAVRKKLKVKTLHLEPYARDLDTLKDMKYLKQHLEMVYNPKPLGKLLDLIC
ncbi:MAG: hypothetical protein ACTSW1_13810 [Candidatus Hodarchaeales archaeon]